MSYTINNTRGSVVTTVTPGTTQVVGGITLIGKNYTGYGELIAEDFVKLLENQANNSNPTSPLTGQLWYDTTENILKVYDSSAWDRLTPTVSGSAPSSPTAGTFWVDTSTGNTLKIYTGTAWVSTSMAANESRQQTLKLKVKDNSWVSTSIRKNGFVSNSDAEVTVTAIIGRPGPDQSSASDQVLAVYSPASFNISSATANLSNSSSLEYDIYNSFTSTVTGAGTQSVNAGLNIRNGFLDASATAPLAEKADAIRDASTPATTYDSTKIMILTKPTAQEHKGSLRPDTDNSVDLGSSTKRYATIYGVATSAKYADIAERFAADSSMDYGTVVALGGAEEITRTAERADDKVFGVISRTPAFRMNDGAGDDTTHPFVAFSGRVDCKVKGPVTKGDRLVSSDIPGVAVKADHNDDWKATFGRALVDKTSQEVEKITIAIGVK
jgi:hypothetical protein